MTRVFICQNAFYGWRENVPAVVVAESVREAMEKINQRLAGSGRSVRSDDIEEMDGDIFFFGDASFIERLNRR